MKCKKPNNYMRRALYLLIILFLFMACTQSGQKVEVGNNEAITNSESVDSTIYGVCGKSVAWDRFYIINALQERVEVLFADSETTELDSTAILGGLMPGDRLAVNALKGKKGYVARKVINLTSLIGRWKSEFRDFELTEDGGIKSFENSKWSEWRILNGQLLLNEEAFEVITLTADTLSIENEFAIYDFARQ